MPITFEEQFKYRDESNLNAAWFRICCDSKNRCGAALCVACAGLVYLRCCNIDNHRGGHADRGGRNIAGHRHAAERRGGRSMGLWGKLFQTPERRAAAEKTRASANTSGSNFTTAVTRR